MAEKKVLAAKKVRDERIKQLKQGLEDGKITQEEYDERTRKANMFVLGSAMSYS